MGFLKRMVKAVVAGIAKPFIFVAKILFPSLLVSKGYSWDKGVRRKVQYRFVALLIVGSYGFSLVQLTGVDAGAGEIEHYSAKRVAVQSKATTGWSTITGTADTGTTASTNGWIDSTNLTAGEDYLIMVWATHVTNNAQVDTSGVRVTHGGSAFGELWDESITDATSIVRTKSFASFTVWNAIASEDIEVEFYASGSTAYVQDVTLIAINAEDLITDGDLQYDVDNTSGSYTTSPTTLSSVTWTPDNNNDTWLVMGYINHNAISTYAADAQARLRVAGTTVQDTSIEPLDTSNAINIPMGWVGEISNSSTTISVDGYEDAADQGHFESGVMALRLDVFETYDYSFTSGNETLNVSNTYEELESISPNLATSGDFLVIGGIEADDNGSQVQMKLQEDTTDITDEHGGWNYNSTDIWSNVAAEFLINESTGVKDFNLDAKSLSGTTGVAAERWLVGFSMELAGGGGGDGTPAEITQRGYIWENDNEDQSSGDSVDENAPLAAGNTALTDVRKGERLTLRTQIDNSGSGSLDTSDELALFYDRNDGVWHKVAGDSEVKNTTGSGCTSTDWDCTEVVDSVSAAFTDIAYTSGGTPFIAYRDDIAGDTLNLAYYVGGSGSGCGGSISDWSCEVIESGNVGDNVQIAVGDDGSMWLAHKSLGSLDLMVAEYVGSGGTGCDSSAWTCSTIESTGNIGDDLTMALDADGDPWIAYRDETNDTVKVAEYVGTGGSGCDIAAWSCTTVETTGAASEEFISIAFRPDGTAIIAYDTAGTSDDLAVAEYVGTGGSGCDSSAWTCTTVYSTNSSGRENRVIIQSDGNPMVVFKRTSADEYLMAAYYVGTGGSGCDSSAWTCETVHGVASEDHGQDISVAIAPDGTPWAVYIEETGGSLELARYVGSGGSGCTSSAWDCDTLVSSNVGSYPSIAFGPDGEAIVSYVSSTDDDIYVMQHTKAGEITISPGISGSSGDNLSESHADMTSVTDTSNRDDADCIGTGGTPAFGTGEWFESEHGSGVSLAAGDTNLQCTEVAWTIDTSQAIEGETYRFVVATDDSNTPYKGSWRGPVAVSQYPTLTIEAETSTRYAKDSFASYSDCNDADWGCSTVTTSSGNGGLLKNSLVIGASGDPWVATAELDYAGGTSTTVAFAEYVGSGGSCTDTAWSCSDIDTLTDQIWSIGADESIDGTKWVGYGSVDGVFVAEYVGSGGSGCDSSAWNCVEVDADASADHVDLAINPITGNPALAYVDRIPASDDLFYAEYVGSGGTGCDDSAWTCYEVDDGDMGLGISFEFNSSGQAHITYNDANAGELALATYVGQGGSGCNTGSDAWECTDIDSTGVPSGRYSSLAFDENDTPWVTYQETDDLRVATYVGGGTGNCTDTDWDCGDVIGNSGTEDRGWFNSIAFDSNGDPWVATSGYDSNTTAYGRGTVAKYVGSGGSGCQSSAWTCEDVAAASEEVTGVSLAFDDSGGLWLSYGRIESFVSYHEIARQHLPDVPLSADVITANQARNAGSGDARYRLVDGRTPSTDPVGECKSTTLSDEGYCGVAALDGQFDTIVAEADEIAYTTYAQKYDVNTSTPSFVWYGETNRAPSTSGTNSDIVLEVYEFGSVEGWVEIGRNDTSADCDGDRCVVSGVAFGTNSDFYEADGSDYWAYFRVYQEANGTSATTLKTDFVQVGEPAQISQQGYIWENDDASGDNATQLAAGDTDLEFVRKGTRLNLRTQLENTGGAFSGEPQLFYDNNDGDWRPVSSGATATTGSGSGCDDSGWTCSVIHDDAGGSWHNSGVAIDPDTGYPMVSMLEQSAGDHFIGRYVGSGASGCGGGSTEWSCEIMNTYYPGAFGLAVSDQGTVWAASADYDIWINKYVGTGGTGCTGGNTRWDCLEIYDNTAFTDGSEIAVGKNDDPWIAFGAADGADDLVVAHYVGSGGTGCDFSVTSYDCVTVDATGDVGAELDIVVDHNDIPWIIYFDVTNSEYKVAHYVGADGNCDSTGGSDAWQCDVVSDLRFSGLRPRIDVAPDGTVWVAFIDSAGTGANGNVWLASYVGSGGDCDSDISGASDAWQCDEVVSDANNYDRVDLTFLPDGSPAIAYRHAGDYAIRYAQYVGTGGSGCFTSAWTGCSAIEDDGSIQYGNYLSIVTDAYGTPWIITNDSNADVWAMRLESPGEGEITLASSPQSTGAQIQESHTDMSSVSDTTGRDDADCLTAGAVWNDGSHIGNDKATVNLPSGLLSPQCSEYSWTIDTSQALAEQTYRFVVAFGEPGSSGAFPATGPASVTEYPTITVKADKDSRIAKGVLAVTGSDCSNTDWSCDQIDTSVATTGRDSSMAFDSNGVAWISYSAHASGAAMAAKYVGSGGNCTSGEWDCTIVDNTPSLVELTAIAIDHDNTPWFTYVNASSGSLMVAKYVGSGGNCTSSEWQCTEVDDTVSYTGEWSSIAISDVGQVLVSYFNSVSGSLMVAEYVGSGGSNCTSTEWTCVEVDDTVANTGLNTRIVFDQNRNPWVAYHDFTNEALRVAQYVGGGGNCTSEAWDCSEIDDPTTSVWDISIAIASDGTPWISFQRDSTELVVATYVGSGGSNCTSGAWDCEVVHDTPTDVGDDTSIAFDPSGDAWISYTNDDDDSLWVARYVGTGGDCDSTEWDCVEIEDDIDSGYESSLVFDPNGKPWISFGNNLGELVVASLKLPSDPLSADNNNIHRGRNAGSGDAFYRLDLGVHPLGTAVCSGTTDEYGYCGIRNADGAYDSISALAGQRPFYTYAMRVDANTEAPTIEWTGRTDLAPNTSGDDGDLHLEIYRFGTTNAWESLASDSSASNCDTTDCTISGMPTGTLSEYFESDSGQYWVHIRVYQIEGSSSIDFRTDSFDSYITGGRLRGGQNFEDEVRTPFRQ